MLVAHKREIERKMKRERRERVTLTHFFSISILSLSSQLHNDNKTTWHKTIDVSQRNGSRLNPQKTKRKRKREEKRTEGPIGGTWLESGV
jgi:hypothetical protein